jgi:hypothetical protein
LNLKKVGLSFERISWNIAALRDVNSGFHRAKEDLMEKYSMQRVVSPSKDKGDSHESYNNRAGNSARSHKHRRPGADQRPPNSHK